MKSNEYSKKILKRLGVKILIYSLVFTLIFALLIFLGMYIADFYIWYPNDPLYIILVTIKKNVFTIWSLGICILLFLYLVKALQYIDYVMQASNDLMSKDNKLIKLPSDLSELEFTLNNTKQNAIQNEILAKTNEERKNELIVYLAHDLKTPLTSIIGYLELLSDSNDLPIEQRAKYINITLKKAHRLEELINEFFEIARFNVGSIVLNKCDLNLQLMLRQIVDEFYPVSKDQKKNIVINCDSSINICADPDKISRVFNNIIKNAISYSFSDSIININVFDNENNIIVNIQNEGNTIPQNKLDYIFEKFYRLDEARSSNSGGSGLGLAIAKEIVQAHDGMISATSKDNVTTFTVVLKK